MMFQISLDHAVKHFIHYKGLVYAIKAYLWKQQCMYGLPLVNLSCYNYGCQIMHLSKTDQDELGFKQN